MSNDEGEVRRQVGIALRFPVVAVLAVLWVIYLWWWIAGIGVAAIFAFVVLMPIAYPPIYVIVYLVMAFNNEKGGVLPGYFEGYPDDYVKHVGTVLKVGFPTLRRWLFEGFGSRT